MASRRDDRVLVIAFTQVGQQSHSYYVSRDKADIMLARGQATESHDGTRRIFERKTRARGEHRVWRKTPCYDPNDRTTVSTMQLVVG